MGIGALQRSWASTELGAFETSSVQRDGLGCSGVHPAPLCTKGHLSQEGGCKLSHDLI